METDNSVAKFHPLEEAKNADHAQLLVCMVESHPENLLILPVHDSRPLKLHSLNLSNLVLQDMISNLDAKPDWWHPDGYAQFKKANMNGANLQKSDFSGIDLSGADFNGVTMRQATLKNTRLEGANFENSDLSGSQFPRCIANEANFTNALLEDARFEDSILRFANFKDALLDGANFQKADLWGCQMQKVEAVDVDFSSAVFRETSLQNAKLAGSNFRASNLKNVDLSAASLRGADFTGATLGQVNLQNADLSGASLPRVDLSSCNLEHAKFADAWLENTRFQVTQLGGAVGEEIEGDFNAARQAYFALEQNFRTIGNLEAASWAFKKGRRMGKRHSFVLMRQSWSTRNWKSFLMRSLDWAGDAFAEWLCDYGESLPRVLRAFLVTLVSFAGIYDLSNSLRYVPTSSHAPGNIVRNPFELLSFSFFAMCNVGLPDLGFKPVNSNVFYLISTEYVCGLVLIGLFGYVLGNRLRR